MSDLEKYYFSLLNDSIFLDDKIIDDNEGLEILLSDRYLVSLKEKLEELEKEQYFPDKIMSNVEKIIEYINQSDNKELINEIQTIFFKVKNMKSTNRIYEYELITKYLKLDEVVFVNDIKYNPAVIEKSIIFDYIALSELINPSGIEKNTELYVYSIKKFLAEYPDMFLNKDIKERALGILKKYNMEDANKMYNKIKNIKFDSNIFCLTEFKELYDYIFAQNMVVNYKLIEKNKKYIDDSIMKYVYKMIDANVIYSDTWKDNLYEIIYSYRENKKANLSEKEFKNIIIKTNEYVGKLNALNIDPYNLIENEQVLRLGHRIDNSYKISLINNFKKLEVEELIKQDYQILSLYMFSEELYEENKKRILGDAYLSINKFINLAPSIFDNETIYNRTNDILNDKKSKKTKAKIKELHD